MFENIWQERIERMRGNGENSDYLQIYSTSIYKPQMCARYYFRLLPQIMSWWEEIIVDHLPKLILDKKSVSGNESNDILNPHPDTSERNRRTQRWGNIWTEIRKKTNVFHKATIAGQVVYFSTTTEIRKHRNVAFIILRGHIWQCRGWHPAPPSFGNESALNKPAVYSLLLFRVT